MNDNIGLDLRILVTFWQMTLKRYLLLLSVLYKSIWSAWMNETSAENECFNLYFQLPLSTVITLIWCYRLYSNFGLVTIASIELRSTTTIFIFHKFKPKPRPRKKATRVLKKWNLLHKIKSLKFSSAKLPWVNGAALFKHLSKVISLVIELNWMARAWIWFFSVLTIVVIGVYLWEKFTIKLRELWNKNLDFIFILFFVEKNDQM